MTVAALQSIAESAMNFASENQSLAAPLAERGDGGSAGGGDIGAEILRLCSGDHAAASLICEVWAACDVWDDVVDADKAVSPKAANDAFQWAFFGVHENPVYQRFPALALVFSVTVANWLAANELERSASREHRVTAYTLRCSPYDFFVAVVTCVSGRAMGQEAALFFRSAGGPDELNAYLAEHGGI